MTQEEIDQYLAEEEMIPVTFVRNAPHMGFVVNVEHGNADIPQHYKANIPYWMIAYYIKEYVDIDEPQWLKDLGSGVSLTAQKSYKFGEQIAYQRGDATAFERMIHMIEARAKDLIHKALQPRSVIDRDKRIYMAEETSMIQCTQNSNEQFMKWKSASGQRTRY